MASRAQRVVWTPLAQRGLDEVVEHIAQDSPEAAEKVLAAVLGVADSLSVFSSRGRIVPEIRDKSIREVFIYRYRLIYEVTISEVRILALLHGARDFDRRSCDRPMVQASSPAELSAFQTFPWHRYFPSLGTRMDEETRDRFRAVIKRAVQAVFGESPNAPDESTQMRLPDQAK